MIARSDRIETLDELAEFRAGGFRGDATLQSDVELIQTFGLLACGSVADLDYCFWGSGGGRGGGQLLGDGVNLGRLERR